MIDALIHPLLAAQPSVTALVAAAIYPLELPQAVVLPAITYQMVGLRETPTFQTSGWNRYRVQFDCWSLTYAEASAIRSALVASLNGFSGQINGVQIQNINVLQPRERFVHEALQYQLTIEFYIFCNS